MRMRFRGPTPCMRKYGSQEMLNSGVTLRLDAQQLCYPEKKNRR